MPKIKISDHFDTIEFEPTKSASNVARLLNKDPTLPLKTVLEQRSCLKGQKSAKDEDVPAAAQGIAAKNGNIVDLSNSSEPSTGKKKRKRPPKKRKPKNKSDNIVDNALQLNQTKSSNIISKETINTLVESSSLESAEASREPNVSTSRANTNKSINPEQIKLKPLSETRKDSKLDITQDPIPRHDFYQSETGVNIAFYQRESQKDLVKVEFFRQKVSFLIIQIIVHFPRRIVYSLQHPINPLACRWSVGKVKIEVSCEKEQAGIVWTRACEVDDDDDVFFDSVESLCVNDDDDKDPSLPSHDGNESKENCLIQTEIQTLDKNQKDSAIFISEIDYDSDKEYYSPLNARVSRRMDMSLADSDDETCSEEEEQVSSRFTLSSIFNRQPRFYKRAGLINQGYVSKK